MIKTGLSVLEDDCGVVLSRALKDETVVAFGEDGFGKYGRSSIPKTFRIIGIDVDISGSLESPVGLVFIALEGYNADTDGHIFTDKNLEISLNKLLDEWGIEPECLGWGSKEQQGTRFFTMTIDVPKLLLW